MSHHLRRWGAIYLLLFLFLGSWIGQFVMQMIDARNEAHQHGEAFTWGEYLPQFLASTFENWQSEWLQLVVQGAVLLGMKHLIFRADAEDTERIEAKINRLLVKQGIDPKAIDREIDRSHHGEDD